jgi:hypothetical protein
VPQSITNIFLDSLSTEELEVVLRVLKKQDAFEAEMARKCALPRRRDRCRRIGNRFGQLRTDQLRTAWDAIAMRNLSGSSMLGPDGGLLCQARSVSPVSLKTILN